MKIVIKLKESSRIDLKAVLSGITNVTNVEMPASMYAICDIPQEDIKSGGKIDDIFEALGGTNDVEFIHIQSKVPKS